MDLTSGMAGETIKCKYSNESRRSVLPCAICFIMRFSSLTLRESLVAQMAKMSVFPSHLQSLLLQWREIRLKSPKKICEWSVKLQMSTKVFPLNTERMFPCKCHVRACCPAIAPRPSRPVPGTNIFWKKKKKEKEKQHQTKSWHWCYSPDCRCLQVFHTVMLSCRFPH